MMIVTSKYPINSLLSQIIMDKSYFDHMTYRKPNSSQSKICLLHLKIFFFGKCFRQRRDIKSIIKNA